MTVRIERNGPITTVTMDRPAVRNAVNGPTAAALLDAFTEFEEDEAARVAVLCGAGPHFCPGADLKAFAAGTDTNTIDAEGPGPMGPTRLMLSKPTIAAINGHAVAGGLELALWCDLRVMEEDAVLGVFCRRWGAPLIDGGTVRLPRLIGQSRALDLILTGRPVHAEEALAIGLVNRVVPKGQARAAAETLADELAGFPPLTLRADRMSAHLQWDLPLADALKAEGRRGESVLEAETLPGAKIFAAGGGRRGGPDRA